MPRPRSLPPLRFQIAVQYEARALRGDGRSLGLVIRQGPSSWAALALEHPDYEPGSGLEAANRVLEDHAHEIVGEFRSERAARAACRAYALAWVSGRKVAEACECGPIAPARESALGDALKAAG